MENDDIVKRLRARKSFWLNGSSWMMGTGPDMDCNEAADEVERLRECNKELRAAAKAFLRELGRDSEQYEEPHE